MNDLPRHGLVSAATVAQHIDMTEQFVRQHAAELGGHRLNGRYRFDVNAVRSWIAAQRVQLEQPAARRRPGPKTGVGRAIPADVKDW